MSGYIGASPVPQATQHREAFTATASQTSFPTVGYTPQFVDVYLNGIKLAAEDYTATNGSDIVLTTGAALNDILEYVAYTPFEVADQTFTGTTTVDVLSVTGAATGTDLTLSGGIYLGGTGAANKLDDYEEGTWSSTLGGVVASTNAVDGSYTKTGNVVAINGSITIAGKTSGSGNASFQLPFPGANGDTPLFGLQITYNNADAAYFYIAAYNGGTTGFIYAAPQNAYSGSAYPNSVIKFNGTYLTTT